MGCDGGTTALERKYLRSAQQKGKSEEADRAEVNFVRWNTCAASNEPLRKPVVCCRLGFLFNKEAVVEQLLARCLHPKFKHIRRLKDLVDLKLTENPAYRKDASDSKSFVVTSGPAPFICPVTHREMNGSYGFSAIAACGCVLSTKAIREVPSDTCLMCGTKYTAGDVITLNPDDEERKAMKVALRAERKAAKTAAATAPAKAEAATGPTSAAAAAAAGVAPAATAAVSAAPMPAQAAPARAEMDMEESKGSAAAAAAADRSSPCKRRRPDDEAALRTAAVAAAAAAAAARASGSAAAAAAPSHGERKSGATVLSTEALQRELAARRKGPAAKRRKGRHGVGRAEAEGATVAPSLSAAASSAVAAAMRAMKETRERSAVFSSLFNDRTKATGVLDSNESHNLFIRVATHRFTT